MFLLTYFFRARVRDANRRIRTAIASINSFLQERITGMHIVQLFNREKRAREQFAALNKQHMDAYKDAIDAFSVFYPGVEFAEHRRRRAALLGGRRKSDFRRNSHRHADHVHDAPLSAFSVRFRI